MSGDEMGHVKVSKNKWEEIILKSDNAYFFNSPTWAKILEKTYDYRTATRLYKIEGKSILIPMMKRNIYGFKTYDSMPHGYGGIFSESDITTDDLRCLVDDIVGGRNLIFHLALPPFFDISSPAKSTTKIKDEWNVKDEWNYTHLLNIDGKDFEDIWKNYKRKTRQHIRKAKKSSIEIKDGTSLDDFRDFYNLYLNASQKWGHESPEYPFNFYRNVHKYGSPHVKLSLATKDEKTIAGLITFHYSKTIYFWGSAFFDEYGTFNPTSLLFNDSIEQACQENYKYINFGGSGKLKGVRRFKEGFGAQKVEISRYKVYSNLGKIALILNRGL
jgi:Acetyltransferase (GNAT) domain